MKKTFLIAAILLAMAFAVFNLTNTQDINSGDLIGYWEPDEESSQLFFWENDNGEIQVQEISGTSGEPIDVLDFKIYNKYFLVKTIFKPTNWVANSKYTFINKTTLSCIVETSTGSTELIYTKIK
jgi:uncharacterized membrane protein